MRYFRAAIAAILIAVSALAIPAGASANTNASRQKAAWRDSNRWVRIIRANAHNQAELRALSAQAKSNPAIGLAIARTSYSQTGYTIVSQDGSVRNANSLPATLSGSTFNATPNTYGGCWRAYWWDKEHNSAGQTLGATEVGLGQWCVGPGWTAIISGSITGRVVTNSVQTPYCLNDIHEWQGPDGRYVGNGNWTMYHQLSEADWGYGFSWGCITTDKLAAIQRYYYYGYVDHVMDWGPMP